MLDSSLVEARKQLAKSPRAKTNLDLYDHYEPSEDSLDRLNTQMNKLQAKDAAGPNGDYGDERKKRMEDGKG